MSECYCVFDQYMAHVKQMVHIRSQCSHHYHLGICQTMVPRFIFQGKDAVVECLWPKGNNLLHISIYCNHLPARCFSIQVQSHKVIMLTLLTHTYFPFSDWSTFRNQTTKNSKEFHTDPHSTQLEGYRHLHLHGLIQHPHLPSIKI